MQAKYPERIVAIWFRSGTAYSYWQKPEDPTKERTIPEVVLPPAAYEIPMMANPGAKENGDKRFNTAWTGSLAMFKDYRAKGAPIGFAPDPPSLRTRPATSATLPSRSSTPASRCAYRSPATGSARSTSRRAGSPVSSAPKPSLRANTLATRPSPTGCLTPPSPRPGWNT
jgi:hypothetical protein